MEKKSLSCRCRCFERELKFLLLLYILKILYEITFSTRTIYKKQTIQNQRQNNLTNHPEFLIANYYDIFATGVSSYHNTL